MPTPALVDDLNPEAINGQLTLADDTLAFVEVLRDAGAITTTSLALTGTIEYDRYEALGKYLGEINRSCSWWVGDWLLYGEGEYGERWSQAASVTGLSEQTLLARMYVCRNVPPTRRRPTLAFSLHAKVASLPAKEQTRWLDRAERNNWTTADLVAAMKAKRRDERPPMFPDDTDPLGPEVVLEAARAVVGSAQEYGDGGWLVSSDAMARLRAAVGME